MTCPLATSMLPAVNKVVTLAYDSGFPVGTRPLLPEKLLPSPQALCAMPTSTQPWHELQGVLNLPEDKTGQSKKQCDGRPFHAWKIGWTLRTCQYFSRRKPDFSGSELPLLLSDNSEDNILDYEAAHFLLVQRKAKRPFGFDAFLLFFKF